MLAAFSPSSSVFPRRDSSKVAPAWPSPFIEGGSLPETCRRSLWGIAKRGALEDAPFASCVRRPIRCERTYRGGLSSPIDRRGPHESMDGPTIARLHPRALTGATRSGHVQRRGDVEQFRRSGFPVRKDPMRALSRTPHSAAIRPGPIQAIRAAGPVKCVSALVIQ